MWSTPEGQKFERARLTAIQRIYEAVIAVTELRNEVDTKLQRDDLELARMALGVAAALADRIERDPF